MIRKATWDDLDAIERLYDEMHDAKAAGLIITNWKRGIYPSRSMYCKHGFEEVGIATSELNGIPGVTLVMLEKHLNPKQGLFLKQKHLLDTFLENGAISQAQYDKSLGDLREKMGINDAD